MSTTTYKFYRGTDDTLVRESTRGRTEILWPSGEWAPYPDADMIHEYKPITEKGAKMIAGKRDLYATGLTAEQHRQALTALGG